MYVSSFTSFQDPRSKILSETLPHKGFRVPLVAHRVSKFGACQTRHQVPSSHSQRPTELRCAGEGRHSRCRKASSRALLALPPRFCLEDLFGTFSGGSDFSDMALDATAAPKAAPAPGRLRELQAVGHGGASTRASAVDCEGAAAQCGGEMAVSMAAEMALPVEILLAEPEVRAVCEVM
jgi:hypothetical protein